MSTGTIYSSLHRINKGVALGIAPWVQSFLPEITTLSLAPSDDLETDLFIIRQANGISDPNNNDSNNTNKEYLPAAVIQRKTIEPMGGEKTRKFWNYAYIDPVDPENPNYHSRSINFRQVRLGYELRFYATNYAFLEKIIDKFYLNTAGPTNSFPYTVVDDTQNPPVELPDLYKGTWNIREQKEAIPVAATVKTTRTKGQMWCLKFEVQAFAVLIQFLGTKPLIETVNINQLFVYDPSEVPS